MATFRDVSAAIGRQAVRLRVAPLNAARATAPLLARSVHAVFGRTPPLASLSDATQAERLGAGFSANEPLLRSGKMRASWEPGVGDGPDGPTAGVGTDDPIAVDQEFGYHDARANREVPPRAAGWEGFQLAQPEARAVWKETLREAIKGD